MKITYFFIGILVYPSIGLSTYRHISLSAYQPISLSAYQFISLSKYSKQHFEFLYNPYKITNFAVSNYKKDENQYKA